MSESTLEKRYYVYQMDSERGALVLLEPAYPGDYGQTDRPFYWRGYETMEEAEEAIVESGRGESFVILTAYQRKTVRG